MTYTLGITPVDPIAYQLPFERFLNPDRVTMPDIDVDFEDGRRDEVIAYVTRKYGSDHVAQIITFGTMLARAAIRDVGRVLGHGYGEVDRIAKAIPNQLGIKLDEALETAPELREMVDGDPSVKRIIDFARQLEGVARNASTHAAGVVISREPLTELMPLQKATNSDALMTQYEMHAHRGAGPAEVRLPRPLEPDDPAPGRRPHRAGAWRSRSTSTRSRSTTRKTFELLASGETTGMFQLESAGMRRYIRELRPTSVYDLAAMVALYRPGPDGQHPRLHPPQARPGGGDLPPPAARAVPGEDLRDLRVPGGHHGRRDGPRRLHRPRGGHARLRDPQEEVVGAARPEGEVRHARPPSAASRPKVIDAVFKAFEPFERYGFNKAHATCYGLIAYQTAYLKANYTVEYMTERAHRLPLERGEGRRRDRRVPPDGDRGAAARRPREPASSSRSRARRSGSGCWRSRTSARARSSRSSRRAPRAARSARWPTSARAIDLRLVNRKVLESLARVGAINAFGHPAQILLGLDDAMAAGQAEQRDRITGQTSLFDLGAADAAASSGRCRPRPRSRFASGSAGRRSSSGCTSRSTRWASSPRRSGHT